MLINGINEYCKLYFQADFFSVLYSRKIITLTRFPGNVSINAVYDKSPSGGERPLFSHIFLGPSLCREQVLMASKWCVPSPQVCGYSVSVRCIFMGNEFRSFPLFLCGFVATLRPSRPSPSTDFLYIWPEHPAHFVPACLLSRVFYDIIKEIVLYRHQKWSWTYRATLRAGVHLNDHLL